VLQIVLMSPIALVRIILLLVTFFCLIVYLWIISRCCGGPSRPARDGETAIPGWKLALLAPVRTHTHPGIRF